MRALTLRQPFASLIAAGIKTVETRIWRPKELGDVLICAGVGKDLNLHENFYHHYDQLKFQPGHTVKGIALCVVEIHRVRPMIDTDIDAAVCMPYHRAQSWFLRNVREVCALKVKGAQGFFNVDDKLIYLKDQPTANCPKCGIKHHDYDGLGVLHCDICGYCSHPNSEDGICRYCGEKV